MSQRVGEVQHRRKAKLEWQLENREGLACGECGKRMETLRLFDVPVDRCRAHGVWLDAGELDKILAQAGGDTRGGSVLHAIVDIFWLWG
jgi:hypothetical protein